MNVGIRIVFECQDAFAITFVVVIIIFIIIFVVFDATITVITFSYSLRLDGKMNVRFLGCLIIVTVVFVINVVSAVFLGIVKSVHCSLNIAALLNAFVNIISLSYTICV